MLRRLATLLSVLSLPAFAGELSAGLGPEGAVGWNTGGVVLPMAWRSQSPESWMAWGVRGRLHGLVQDYGPPPFGIDLGLTLRAQPPSGSGAFGALNAGWGLMLACVQGNACGGSGPLVGVEAGYRFGLTPTFALDLGLDLAAQYGLPNFGGPLPLVGSLNLTAVFH